MPQKYQQAGKTMRTRAHTVSCKSSKELLAEANELDQSLIRLTRLDEKGMDETDSITAPKLAQSLLALATQYELQRERAQISLERVQYPRKREKLLEEIAICILTSGTLVSMFWQEVGNALAKARKPMGENYNYGVRTGFKIVLKGNRGRGFSAAREDLAALKAESVLLH